MRSTLWLSFLLALTVAGRLDGQQDPARFVDPLIGTGGHGHTYPGATLPFAMVQLSPDTRLEGWDGCSGYHDSDRVVYGFSHTHLSGTGISDYGDVLLMPMTGPPKLENGAANGPEQGYASRFEKSTERAEAGFYAVELADYQVGVELTVTERAGFHRYRLPAGQPASVIVDLEHRDRVLEAGLTVVSDREIEGFRRSTGWAEDQVVYFVARFSRPFTEPGLAGGDRVTALSFGDAGGELMVQVAISAVDVAGARANLEAELPDWDFDAVRRAARQRWNESLGRIEVEGGSAATRRIFYTALYHSLIAPNLYSDVDGRYRGMDREIHRAEGRRHYTVFSLWDTFRATHPLYTLLERERTREFIRTFLAMYRQGGRLPVWELAGNETDTMIGYHAVPVIVDAWVKGIRDFDQQLALEAMIDSAHREHFGLAAYARQGFIGSRDDGESVSKTLEYAYDDWCIAQMARGVGREETAGDFLRRSQGWRHLLDPQTSFMRARRNQRWVEDFDPWRVDNHYTEANSWQYSFFVPQDVEGLIEAFGGEAAFLARLDELFTADSATTGRDQVDITGLIGQYAHGNEPSHHMAWLAHYAGRPDQSAARVREILTTLYGDGPEGLAGNEDCGQMSSWYVLAAMGIYPACPCSPDWLVGVPLFERVRLRFEDGESFTIRTEGEGDQVVAARLGGEPLTRSYLRHEEIVAGGELVLSLGSESGWGSGSKDRPRSAVSGERILAAPYAIAESDAFRGHLEVALASADAGVTIRHAQSEAGPFAVYEDPIDLRDSATIRFFAEKEGAVSPTVEASFHRIPHDWQIELAHEPNRSYTAGGPMALIDGLRGTRAWRTGSWHGYQLTDFEATVDLGEVRAIRQAGASFLQDVRSWIWMPTEVVISVSGDGATFHPVARLGHQVPSDDTTIYLRELTAELEAVEGRFVRIFARNLGPIPDWHPGHGGLSFIFVDEILIQ